MTCSCGRDASWKRRKGGLKGHNQMLYGAVDN
jgi:hypothetical protein